MSWSFENLATGTAAAALLAVAAPTPCHAAVNPAGLGLLLGSSHATVRIGAPEASQDPAAIEEMLGLDRPARRAIQLGLRSEGFDPGAADGLFGSGTRAEIRRWQEARGVPLTGYLDSAEAQLLRVAGLRLAAEQGDADAQFTLGDMYANGEGVWVHNAEAFVWYHEAVRWYRLAAEQGHAEAQFNLGDMYANGDGVERDDAEAFRWHRLAAEQDHAEAQFNLGDMYANGEGVERDDAEAVRWHRLAAEQGHADAQASLRLFRVAGLRLSAEQGDAEAQFNLGDMYANGEGMWVHNAEAFVWYREAVRWYRLAAEQGHAEAQFNLGDMYANGDGVEKDDVLAYAWITLAGAQGHVRAQEAKELLSSRMTREEVARAEAVGPVSGQRANRPLVDEISPERLPALISAAEQGSADAQFNLGEMYRGTRRAISTGTLTGTLVIGDPAIERDEAEALRWYRLAAEQGHADAQARLGEIFANGEGLERNEAEAIRWYRLAAEQGSADAQASLGDMYANGEGLVGRNDAEAIRWYRLAAEQGHVDAQASLGEIFTNGEGLERNDAEAIRWYRLAAEQGSADAQASLGDMYANGEGLERNDAEAARWYGLAAEQGHAVAQAKLRRAAEQGNSDAQAAIATLHDLQLSGGPPSRGFTLMAITGMLPPGTLSLAPRFEPGVTAYGVTVSRPQLTIRAKAAAGMTMRATGSAADGAALDNVNQSYVGVNESGFLSVTLAGLEAGKNTIRIAVSGPTYTGRPYIVVATYEPSRIPQASRVSERDDAKGVRAAAEQGDAPAQDNPGARYATRLGGLMEDDTEAVRRHRAAAEQGDAIAQFNLGVKYHSGDGVPRNDAEAVRWYRAAAEQGLASAQYNLGAKYDNGEGVPEDDAEAVRWYRAAAEQGDAPAQSSLGLMYYHGQGVPRDLVLAYAWMTLAGAQGYNRAQPEKTLLSRRMTHEQVARAEELSVELLRTTNKP